MESLAYPVECGAVEVVSGMKCELPKGHGESHSKPPELPSPLVCAIGGKDDGSLRVCCSSHGKVLCGKHYARSHFVEVGTDWERTACNEVVMMTPSEPVIGQCYYSVLPDGTRMQFVYTGEGWVLVTRPACECCGRPF
jgi:hypothetical protein